MGWNYPTNSHVVKCYYVINDGRRNLSQEEIDNIKKEMINDLLKKLNKKELPPGYEFIFPTTEFVGSKSKVINRNKDGYTLTVFHDKEFKKTVIKFRHLAETHTFYDVEYHARQLTGQKLFGYYQKTEIKYRNIEKVIFTDIPL